jgi:hypothetical protein
LTGAIVKKMEGHSTVVRDVHWHPFKPEIISSGVYHLLPTVLFTLLVGRSIYEMGLQAAVTNQPRANYVIYSIFYLLRIITNGFAILS